MLHIGGTREMLTGVRTVIVDEIHAVAGTKRGAHLALSLERLDALPRAAQRIGLSATVKPAEEVAWFLTGSARPATIVAPPAARPSELSVRVPVPGHGRSARRLHLAGCGGTDCRPHQAHNRRSCSRIHAASPTASRINEIHAERSGIVLNAPPNWKYRAVPRTSWAAARPTAPNPCWRAHITVRSARNSEPLSRTT